MVGPALELAWIGTALGLRHGVARDNVALEEGLEILRLLLGCSEGRQDLGIAGVGRLGPEHPRSPGRTGHDLVHQRQLDLAVSQPSEVGAQVGGPQALVPDLLLEWLEKEFDVLALRHLVDVMRIYQSQRLYLLPHELPHPGELLLKLRIRLELPRHRSTSLMVDSSTRVYTPIFGAGELGRRSHSRLRSVTPARAAVHSSV